MNARRWSIAAAAACMVTVSSCSSLNVNALPQPGPSYDDGYDVIMRFESVLNLPERAKVVLDGVPVGVVSNVTLRDHDVDVTARVARGVVIPVDIHAVLQQATVLGDIYVALERPSLEAAQTPTAPPAPALRAGQSIPISQTTSPPQLEDTIASLANFVTSGSIQRAQNTVIRLNRVIPTSTEVTTLATTMNTDIAALSANIDRVDQTLDGVSRTAAAVDGHVAELQYLFSPIGQRGFEHGMDVGGYIGRVLPGIGSITANGYWLVPFLNSLADSVGAVQQSKVAGEAEIPQYKRLFNEYFLPAEKYPAINITSIIGPDGRELSGNVQEVLRILGAMR